MGSSISDEDVMAAFSLCRLKHARSKDPLPPSMPPVPTLRGLVGRCSDPFQKNLMMSDVDRGLNRLMLSKSVVEKCVLPLLDGGASLEIQGIPVKVYSTAGDEYEMEFNRWSGGKAHVINKRWMDFVRDVGLKQGETITLWAFRHAVCGSLCFLVASSTASSDDTDKP